MSVHNYYYSLFEHGIIINEKRGYAKDVLPSLVGQHILIYTTAGEVECIAYVQKVFVDTTMYVLKTANGKEMIKHPTDVVHIHVLENYKP